MLIRSRIERLFGWWSSWRGIKKTKHGRPFISRAAHTILVIEHLARIERPPLYRSMGVVKDWGKPPICKCKMQKEEGAQYLEGAKRHRAEVVKTYKDDLDTFCHTDSESDASEGSE
jgi:uncharacterized protein (DUF58 family)